MAHSSNVNCLKIGRKTSRVLLTGGEDHKVNLWAIGKPNSILVRLICLVLFRTECKCGSTAEYESKTLTHSAKLLLILEVVTR